VPASPDRWVPPVSDGPRPRSLPLSLPLPGGAGLSAPVSSRALASSLCPVGSLYQRWPPVRVRALVGLRTPPISHLPFLTSCPRTPSWTRPRRAFPDFFPTRPTSFWSLHSLAHSPRSVAPPVDPLAPLPRTARTPVELFRSPASVSWPSSSSCRVHCPGNPGRWSVIVRLRSADTPSRGSFVKKTLGFLRINLSSLVFACRTLYFCRKAPDLLSYRKFRPSFVFEFQNLFISYLLHMNSKLSDSNCKMCIRLFCTCLNYNLLLSACIKFRSRL
jgi:hypothetical protein